MTVDTSPSMSPTDWITLCLGIAAFSGTIWSNYTAQRALKLTGQQRVAEFRKEWLECLRTEVADFLAYDQSYSARVSQIEDIKIARQIADATTKPMLDQRAIDLVALKEREHTARAGASAKILLRLNDDEEINGEILQSMTAVMASNDETESAKARALLVVASRKLFKSEWDRLSNEMKPKE